MSVLQPIFGRAMYVDAIVTAGQPVLISGDESISPAIAGTDYVAGIALMDGAVGEKITVELFCKGIVSVVASAAIVAGQQVAAAANGSGPAGPLDLVYGVALTGALATESFKVAVR